MLKQLHEAMSGDITLNLTIKKKGEEIIVMVIPKAEVEDKATENIPPIVASGTPEEVEQGIIEAIVNPLKGISETVSGIKEFEEKQKQIDAENKTKKAEKEAKKKEKEAKKKEDASKPDEQIEFEKLLVEGTKAIEEKKDISAKSIKIKLEALVNEKTQEQYDVFCTKFDKFIEEVSSTRLF